MDSNSSSPVYEATTQGVRVQVVATFMPQHSDPPNRWFWAYSIRIDNFRDQRVQLVSRRWVITDARGKVEVVEGSGVVGETPVIEPGASHAYVSGCPLPTPSGVMVGVFRMQLDDDAGFEAAIPAFSLDLPDARRVFN